MLGGIPLAILGTVAGIAGSLLTDKLMQKSGIRNGIRDAIAGTSATPTGGTGTGTGTGGVGDPPPPPPPPPSGGDF